MLLDYWIYTTEFKNDVKQLNLLKFQPITERYFWFKNYKKFNIISVYFGYSKNRLFSALLITESYWYLI